MGVSYRSILLPAGFLVVLLSGCLASEFYRAPEPISRPGEQNLQMGAVYEQRGEWNRALSEYTEATRHTDRGHLALGNLYAKRGNLAESEKHFRLAMRSIRDNAALYNDLAAVLLEQQKDLEEAEELAMLSVKIADQRQFATSWDTLNAIRQRRDAVQSPESEDKTPPDTEKTAEHDIPVPATPPDVAQKKPAEAAPAAVVPVPASPSPAKEKPAAVSPEKAAKKAPVKAATPAPKKATTSQPVPHPKKASSPAPHPQTSAPSTKTAPPAKKETKRPPTPKATEQTAVTR